jgi:hypothetical protein
MDTQQNKIHHKERRSPLSPHVLLHKFSKKSEIVGTV